MKWSLEKKIGMGFGLALSALILVGVVSYRNTIRLITASRGVAHTHEVLTELEATLSAIQGAETGQRGYVITGDDRHLEAYEAEVARVYVHVQRVNELTHDNPDQERRIASLKPRIDERLAILKAVLDARKNQGFESARQSVLSGRGKQEMDEIRRIVAEMESEERALLSSRTSENEVSARAAIYAISAFTILAWVLLGIGFYLINRDIAGRKLAEEELDQFFTLSLDMLCIAGFDGYFKRLNPAWEQTLGFTAQELLARPYLDFLHPEDRAATIAEGQKLATGVVTITFENRYSCKDGSYKWLLWKSTPLAGQQLIFATARDITNRKQAEKALEAARDELEIRVSERTAELAKANDKLRTEIAERKLSENELRQSEERFRLIAENVADLIAVLDLEGRRLYNSPSYKELIGEPDAMRGTLSFDEIHPDDREKIEQVFQETVRTGRGQRAEFRFLLPNGGVRFIESQGSTIRDEAGKPIRVLVVSRDITERKDAEKHLAQMEGRYRGLLEAAPDAMVVVSPGGEIVLLNLQAEKQFGYRRDELVGKNVKSIIPEGFAERLIADALRSAEDAMAQQIGTGIELTGRRKDGSDFPIEIMLSPLESAEGILVTAAIRDISERKQLEEQFRQAQKMEAVGRLAGGVAHDFNNLLTIIIGYSQLLLERLKPDDPLRGQVGEILEAGGRAALLTRQLLAFSRQQVLQLQVLDLNGVVANVEKMLRRLIGEDIELKTVLSRELGRVKADAGQLEQVFMNLAVNARDAMPQGGKLTIETANVTLDEAYTLSHAEVTSGCYVMLAVSDTGIGMDAETQARIFEPFFTTKEKGKGTGLGLSTVYGIVKQSGGYIWVYSEPERGTTFKIYMPRVEEAVEAAELEKPPAKRAMAQETVLLVEDEVGVRSLVRGVLTSGGYIVLEAGRGEEALRLAELHQGPIHLMLTDVVMPGMSGRELAERLRTSRPEMKVLYMSGYTDTAIVHHGVLDAGTAFLQKPFTPEALAEKVREVLNMPREAE